MHLELKTETVTELAKATSFKTMSIWVKYQDLNVSHVYIAALGPEHRGPPVQSDPAGGRASRPAASQMPPSPCSPGQ